MIKFVSVLTKNSKLYNQYNDDYLMVNQTKDRNVYIHLGDKTNEKLFNTFPIYHLPYGEKAVYITDSELYYMYDEVKEALDGITESTSYSKKYKITQYNLGYNV